MEARGALLAEESYAPPVYDEAAHTVSAAQPNPIHRAAMTGVSRGTGDSYVALNDTEEREERAAQRANDIAMRRQQEHAKAFQRQMQAEEDHVKSAQKQIERDAEVAARLAAGHDESAAFASLQQAQRDAAIAADLQRQLDAQNPRLPRGITKTVRVSVPPAAKPGDKLSVTTPTAGKFDVTVPTWAAPGTTFDCDVTVTVTIKNPHQPHQQPGLSLPPGWERIVNAQGRPFYVDHNTRTTHWNPPPPPPPAPPAPPAPSADSQRDGVSGMTEEEMLAEAIARSLQDAPPQDDTAKESEAVPPSPAHEPVPPPPAPVEQPDLLGLEDDDQTLPPATTIQDPSSVPPSTDEASPIQPVPYNPPNI